MMEGNLEEGDINALEHREVAKNPSFESKMFRYEQGDPNVTEICGRSKELVEKRFYLSTDDLQSAKLCSNATKFAKSLLVAIFSDRALFECSVSGGQYRAGGRDNITRKPPLNSDAINVICDVALSRQKTKHWKPEQSKKELMAGLRQKLVDLRPRLKLLFAEGA